MSNATELVPKLLMQLVEEFHGRQQPCWPTEPYEFIVWWHCGYPASDERCAKGWAILNRDIGTSPRQILAAAPKALAAALKPAVMLPDLAAQRLKEIAARVQDEFGGDLRRALIGPLSQARKVLKQFHSIADPGADRILFVRRYNTCRRRAFELSARTGAPIAWIGARELRSHLPGSANGDIGPGAGNIRCAPAGVPAAQAAWATNLQTNQPPNAINALSVSGARSSQAAIEDARDRRPFPDRAADGTSGSRTAHFLLRGLCFVIRTE
jgi:hypothetical protein